MTDYGVTPTGFSRKPLSIILAEIEAANITQFGPGLVQTSQSPMGQINGLMAELINMVWELGEDIYQSYDPDQAEGARLGMLARLRLINRAEDETDPSFRRAITNEGQARIDLQDISRAVADIPGVTYSHVWVNDDDSVDENGMPAGSICVAVTGGDDAEIAAAVRRYVVPGITVFGNTEVESVVDGYCRTLRILRPIEVPVTLSVTVRTFKDQLGCPPPAATAIETALLNGLYLLNGDDITAYRIRSVIENSFSNVEVISFEGERNELAQAPGVRVDIAFIERATLAADYVTIVVA